MDANPHAHEAENEQGPPRFVTGGNATQLRRRSQFNMPRQLHRQEKKHIKAAIQQKLDIVHVRGQQGLRLTEVIFWQIYVYTCLYLVHEEKGASTK